jgi:hypothetical protein
MLAMLLCMLTDHVSVRTREPHSSRPDAPFHFHPSTSDMVYTQPLIFAKQRHILTSGDIDLKLSHVGGRTRPSPGFSPGPPLIPPALPICQSAVVLHVATALMRQSVLQIVGDPLCILLRWAYRNIRRSDRALSTIVSANLRDVAPTRPRILVHAIEQQSWRCSRRSRSGR